MTWVVIECPGRSVRHLSSGWLDFLSPAAVLPESPVAPGAPPYTSAASHSPRDLGGPDAFIWRSFLARFPFLGPAHKFQPLSSPQPHPKKAGMGTGPFCRPGRRGSAMRGAPKPESPEPGLWSIGLGSSEEPGQSSAGAQQACPPGADDVLVQAALTALALGPEAREALLQGVQVGHLGMEGLSGRPCAPPAAPPRLP